MRDIIESTILCLSHLEFLVSYDTESSRAQLAKIETLLIQGCSLEEVLEDLTW
jgi:hypothetical protein